MNGKQLKNSILQWAIQGKLVPQDPNDEPASVLLERIRAEKARLVKEKKIKKDKNESIIYRGDDNSYYEKFLATGEVKCIDEEIPFEIPSSWEWCRLGNICSYLHRGKSPKYGEYKILPIIAQKCNQWDKVYTDRCLFSSKDYIEKYKEEQFVLEGDIIINSTGGGTVGRTGYIDSFVFTDFDRFVVDSHVTLVRSIYPIASKYIYYFLISPLIQIGLEDRCSGSTNQIELGTTTIANYLVPIPPINEQNRIIEQIQKILPLLERYSASQIAQKKLNAEINILLKKSILQEAIQGKLVPQIVEDGTAEELLAEIRKEKERLVKEGKLKKSAQSDSVIFKGDDNKYWEKKGKTEKDITDEIPFEIPDSWAWVRLSIISDIIGGYAFQSSSLKEEQGKRVIRISDISEQGFVNTKIVRYNGTPISDIYRIKKFDIIMAMTGGTVGKCLFVRELPEDELLLNQRVARIRNLWISVDYLNFVIIAPHIKEFISKQKNSTNDNISMADISNFLIPLPPIKEQLRIVEKLYNLASIMSR